MEKQRITYIDGAKAIAIVLVIIGHCYWVKEKPSIPYVYSFLYSFHMPLFFIIAGWFIKPLTIKEALAKYSKAYLVPYFFTSLASGVIAASIILYKDADYSMLPFFKRWALSTIYANPSLRNNLLFGDMPIVGILWFLFAIFWSNTIYSILKKRLDGFELFVYTVALSSIAIVSLKVLRLPFSIQSGVAAMIFVWVGDIAQKYKLLDKFSKLSKDTILLLLILWAGSVLKGTFTLTYCKFPLGEISFIGAITGSFLLLLLCKKMHIGGGKIGNITMLILCVHHAIHYGIMESSNPAQYLPFSPLVNCLLELILHVSVTIGISLCLLKFRLIRYIYNY